MGLFDMFLKIGGDTSHYEKSMRNIQLSTKKTTQAINNAWVMTAAQFYLVMKAWNKAWDMMSIGAKAQQEEASFSNLAASYGANANKLIADLKRASAETMDTMTLINKAGTAMMMGISPEKISKLMEIARVTSRMTGQTVADAFEDIALAVSRQSPRILDNLGIIVSLDKANDDYAKSLGKTSTQLTDAEKKQAFLNATIKTGSELVKRISGEGLTASERMQQYTAAVSDLRTEIGKELVPTMSILVTKTTEAIEGLGIFFGIGRENELTRQLHDSMTALEEVERKLKEVNKDGEVPWWIRATASTGYAGGQVTDTYGTFNKEELEKEKTALEVAIKEIRQKQQELFAPGTPRVIPGGGEETLQGGMSEKEIAAGWDLYKEREDWVIEQTKKGLEHYAEWQQKIREMMLAKDKERLKAEFEEEVEYNRLGVESFDNAMKEKVVIADNFKEDISNAVAGWASNFSSELTDMVWGADLSFKAIATSFGKMLTQMYIQKKMIEPLLGAMEGFSFTKFLGIGSARGNIFAGAGIGAYENRIVDKPTLFPFAHGIGLFGEGSKAEGVLPLTRTRPGDLGVQAVGGKAGAGDIYVNVTGNTVYDERSLNNLVTRISAAVAYEVAPTAWEADYMRDGRTREIVINRP